MKTRRFEGVRYVVARVTERNARGEASAFWHSGRLHETQEAAEIELRSILPPTEREPEPYKVLAVRDGVWGLKDARFYDWLETADEEVTA